MSKEISQIKSYQELQKMQDDNKFGQEVDERETLVDSTFSEENLNKNKIQNNHTVVEISREEQEEEEENEINDGNFITLMETEDSHIKEERQKNNNLNFNSNFFQKVILYDYLKLLLKCYSTIKKHKILQLKHIPYLSKEQSIDKNYDEFNQKISSLIEESNKQNKKISNMKMIYITFSIFKWPILYQVIMLGLYNIIKIFYSSCIIFLLNALVENESISSIYSWAALLCTVQFVAICVNHNIMRFFYNFFPSLKACFMRIIYQKINNLSSFSIKQANVGKLINLVSNDLNSLETKIFHIITVLTTPFILIVTAIILYSRLDAYSLFGFAFLLAYIPLQIFQAKLSSKYFKMKAQLVDQRIKFTNEIIEGIRLIKMYAWEEAFVQFVVAIRNLEIRKILIIQLIFILQLSLTSPSYMISCFISFISTYNLGDPSMLTVPKMLSVLDLFAFTKQQTIMSVVYGVTGWFEFQVILERIISVLTLEESSMKHISNVEENNKREIKSLPIGSIKMSNFTAYWKIDKPVLEQINLDIKPGEFIGIVGKVGSGKSSLLNCILQEIPSYSGSFVFNGKVAYVEQEPYIFSSTVKENIIFGSELDEDFYQKIIEGCCLVDDIKQLDHGDKTQIGERGVNLSGGQKARISLARAVYSQSDIILLDDPISAVDAKVAKMLIEESILKLLKGKTVLLVTHQVHFTQKMDRVIIMQDGRISAQGTYEELQKQLKDISIFDKKDRNKSNNSSEETKDSIQEDTTIEEEIKEMEEEKIQGQNLINPEENKQTTKKKNNKLFSKEQDENMKVELSTYLKYLSYSSLKWLIPIVVVLFLICEIVFVQFTKTISNYNINDNDLESRLKLLGYIAFIYLINSLIKYLSLTLIIYSANYNIHNKMIQSLVKATVLFFDKTPSGRILNKFSSDLGQIDQEISKTMQDSLEVLSNFIILVINIFMVNPYFIIVVLLELVCIRWFVKIANTPLLQSKQLDLRNRSPIYTCFNQTVSGVLPIRTYRKENIFQKNFNKLIENSLRSSLATLTNQRSFGFYIHFQTTFYSCIGIFMILSTNRDPAQIGQAIIFFLQISDYIQWGLRQMINTDVFMSSALRILNLIDTKQEPDFRNQSDEQFIKDTREENDQKPTKQKESERYTFPISGEIEFQNVRMKYREGLQHVLNGLSFKIKSGQKVGFIGRTGAGKSSVIQALYRLTEIEADSKYYGKSFIKIDGYDTKQLGIHTIRQGISIIPQVPFIFSGNIRRNLDPLNLYEDEKILSILEDINLKEKVLSLEKGLMTDMTNACEVFSSGEKQLICLGRAILRQSRLIVLDEATANCDSHTDQIIQQKLREKFYDSTIITIAHRLNTIADYDKIIIMEKGCVVEEGIPFELLSKENSIFKQMVSHTGQKNSTNILEIAKSAYNKKQY